MTYFISDLHFGHTNCLSYDNRPFTNIQEHDEALIQNWNNKVKTDDEVWILGDLSWYNVDTTINILKRLNGKKKLCIGNHDSHFLKHEKFREQFEEITDYKELKSEDSKGIILCHYPIPCFKNHFYGWYHLYGHVHISFESNMINHFVREMNDLYLKKCYMYNVGCMTPEMDFTPRTLEEIIERSNIDVKRW